MLRDCHVILAADDDEDAHVLLRRAFAQAGGKAVLMQVNNGREAIEYLSGQNRYADREKFPLPDLLLLDWKMPQVSGAGVLEYLKVNQVAHPMKVIVFSSSDHYQDVEQAHQLGCDSYVVKPTDFKSLVVFVASLAKGISAEGEKPKEQAVRPSALKPQSVLPMKRANIPPTEPQKKTFDLSEAPEMFRLLVQQVKDYAIVILDKDGTVCSWNEGARRLNGYEASEVIGKHFSIFYPRPDIEAEKPAFELRMAIEMGRYEEEGWRVRKDGSRFWANLIITPLVMDGRHVGFAKVTRDLTQRKLQEEHFQRLLESEERFRLLVEQVKDYAIFFLDAKGNISSWNQGARRIKGYTADEIIGQHFSVFYTPQDLATAKPERELTIAVREGKYEEEGWRVRKNGTRFWASVLITSLWDKRGNLTGFAKVTRDLTDRKKEEEALRAKTRDLEAFAHTLSHDLRAPIRSISSFSQMLKDDAAELPVDEQRTYLEKIHRAAQSMDSLIRDILKLSSVSLAPTDGESVSIESVLNEVLALVEGEVRSKNAEIAIRGPLPPVKANRTLLLQILSNLVGNALKFVRPGETPKIEIYAVPHNGDCEIHVEDSGPGIPDQFQESIFNIFERGAAEDSIGGSGIGLAIVKKAVERAGGNVQVISRIGEGSDFVVTLPCEAGALSPVPA